MEAIRRAAARVNLAAVPEPTLFPSIDVRSETQ